MRISTDTILVIGAFRLPSVLRLSPMERSAMHLFATGLRYFCSRRSLCALAIILTASGCASAPYKGYEDSSQSTADSATVNPVTSDDGGGFWRGIRLHLAIFAFYDEQKHKTTEIASPHFAQPGRPVHLLPGTYRLNTICATGTATAYPSMSLSVQAGMTYEIACKPVEGSKGGVTLEVVNVFETAGASMQGSPAP